MIFKLTFRNANFFLSANIDKIYNKNFKINIDLKMYYPAILFCANTSY